MSDAPTLNGLQMRMIAAIGTGAPVIGIRAGWGAGKTAGLAFSILWLSVTRPGIRILLILDTGDRYWQVLHPELEKWLGGIGWEFSSSQPRGWVDPSTGSRVLVKSYYRPQTRSVDANSLEGINADVAFIDECQTMNPEVAVRAIGRIRGGKPPQLVLSGVPTWDDWWLRVTRRDPRGVVLLATSYENADNLGADWFEMVKRMSPTEYQVKVLNRPAAPEGAIYPDWVPERFPAGNLAPKGWEYSPEMRLRIAGDWGVRHPSILFIAEDDLLKVDVVVGEINPEGVRTVELARLILERAWPRSLLDTAPGGRFLMDRGCGDVAGRAPDKTDTTLRTTFSVLAASPDDGGIGMRLRSTHDRRRVNVLNGIDAVRRRILDAQGHRALLCTKEVWDRGLESEGVSLAGAFAKYVWQRDSGMVPKKDGNEHPLDALRYDVVNFRWNPAMVRGEQQARPAAAQHRVDGRRSRPSRGAARPSSR